MRFILSVCSITLAIFAALAASGISHPAVDLLSNFHWHFVVAAAALALVAVAIKALKTVLFAGLICVFAFTQTQRFDAVYGDLQSLRSGDQVFTLVVTNIWGRADNVDRVMGFIRGKQPDFVILAELDPDKLERVKSLTDDYPFVGYCPHHLCRLAILSKHPWQSLSQGRQDHHQLPKIDVQFGQDLGNLRLVGIHASRPHYRYDTLRQQLAGLGRSVTQINGPLIVAGDFNSTAFSAPLHLFARESGLVHAGSYKTTWPVRSRHLGEIALPFTQFGIDQFYLNRRVRLIHVERGPDLLSDHHPMIMSFSVKAQ